MLSVLQKLIEVQSSVVAACMGEQEMQWYQWLTKPRPQSLGESDALSMHS